jgi:membrane protease YdiL (CAAX protease family)
MAGFVTAAAFGTSILAQLVALLLEPHQSRASAAANVIGTPLSLARGAVVVQLALAVLVFVFLRPKNGLRQRSLVCTKLSLVALLLCLGIMLGLAPLANDLGFWLSETLHQSSDSNRFVLQIIQHASKAEFLLLAVVLTLLPACVEELLFRGLLMGALSGGPAWLVVGLQAIAFGAFHVDLAQGMATFVLGLGFGFMRLQTRSLLASMVAHATYNVIVLFSMRWLRISSNGAPDEGLVMAILGAFLALVCGVGLLQFFGRKRLSRGLT